MPEGIRKNAGCLRRPPLNRCLQYGAGQLERLRCCSRVIGLHVSQQFRRPSMHGFTQSASTTSDRSTTAPRFYWSFWWLSPPPGREGSGESEGRSGKDDRSLTWRRSSGRERHRLRTTAFPEPTVGRAHSWTLCSSRRQKPFCNYYCFVLGALAFAVATSDRPMPQRTIAAPLPLLIRPRSTIPAFLDLIQTKFQRIVNENGPTQFRRSDHSDEANRFNISAAPMPRSRSPTSYSTVTLRQ